MVCPASLLSTSLAIYLLRNSAPPSQSFVLSPFSLDTALAIINDGAGGATQAELTNLLLNGCSASDVTALYASLASSLLIRNKTGVTFNSANRFYVDTSVSYCYKKRLANINFTFFQVESIQFSQKVEAANEMNKFVNDATNGMIKDVISPDGISNDAKAILINAIYFLGKWQIPFDPRFTDPRTFHGVNGDRKIPFMHSGSSFRINLDNDIGTVLIMEYVDPKYSFFYLMPNKSSNVGTMLNGLTGERLQSVLKGATRRNVHITVPKMKIKSKLDGVELLSKMGVKSLFSNGADLSKISSSPLKVSKITHSAVFEVDEKGTEAAAATMVEVAFMSKTIYLPPPITIILDRPFLFGVRRNDEILFIGQYV
ncbi:hypothetical protein PMAYCL1PPCAC_27137 [Pristionchus mayeri]|uniref:Serpin domain-containing protein n=1 Tax=Pristionchus mayeri TaxID=1317129 RepID=A0AAN5D6H6_9BILA|nr:hypothetical protein PMAYCL1PPCAC_27137 [Pristionchus mayeri]